MRAPAGLVAPAGNDGGLGSNDAVRPFDGHVAILRFHSPMGSEEAVTGGKLPSISAPFGE